MPSGFGSTGAINLVPAVNWFQTFFENIKQTLWPGRYHQEQELK